MNLRRAGTFSVFLLVFLHEPLHAQEPGTGTVSGVVTDPSTHAPLENASVVLRIRADSARVAATPSGKDGDFTFTSVPLGTYFVECSLIGHTSFRSPAFQLSAASPRIALP